MRDQGSLRGLQFRLMHGMLRTRRVQVDLDL